jgi:hypothetical protein
MYEVSVVDVVFGICLFSILYLLLEARNNIGEGSEIHSRLDEMFEALNVVANVLNQLPNLVPQFSIEQNPLMNAIVDWMRQGREEPGEGSIVHHALEAIHGGVEGSESEEISEGSPE